MKKKVMASVLLLSVLLISFASAEIILGQPKSLYNIGDAFEIPITLKSSADTSGFLTANLVCTDSYIELYKSPISAKKDEEKRISISTPLGNFLVFGVNGECYIQAKFADQFAESQKFEITNKVDVTLDITGAVFSPGDAVNLRGKAIKTNDQNVDGFAEISIADINFKSLSAIKSGTYNTSFTVPSNARAGNYEIKVMAYDKDSSDQLMNQGETLATIKIKQVLSSLEVALDKSSVIPGNEISYTVLAYDQADDYILTDASVSVKSSKGIEKQTSVVKTGESSTFKTEENFEPGNWKITAKSETFEVEKEFFVEEFKKIDFTLEGTNLIVKNTGNVPYNGFVEVFINGESRVESIEDLKVGETETLRLKAPDGEYNIEVSDGGERVALGTTLLTGRAISVQDSSAAFRENWFVLLWAVIILALLIAAILIYRKVAKRKFIGKTSGAFTPQKSSASTIPEKSTATQSGVLNKGQKQECAIVAVNIKNFQSLESNNSDGLKAVDSALWQAKEDGAKIYTEGNFRVAVLTPALSKDPEIALSGIRIAEKIERILSEYNKRSAQKVEFGIAVNVGELIHESSGGKMKFVSPDNSVAQTKKISNAANREVVLSEKAHNKTVGKIKTLKVQDRDLWRLEKIVDRSAHTDFINRFKQNQKGTNRY